MKKKPSYPLRIPPSLKRAAERRAAEDGVSLNHWINLAMAEKAAAARVAAYIRRRFGAAQPDCDFAPMGVSPEGDGDRSDASMPGA